MGIIFQLKGKISKTLQIFHFSDFHQFSENFRHFQQHSNFAPQIKNEAKNCFNILLWNYRRVRIKACTKLCMNYKILIFDPIMSDVGQKFSPELPLYAFFHMYDCSIFKGIWILKVITIISTGFPFHLDYHRFRD